MNGQLREAAALFGLERCKASEIPEHNGGRNQIIVLENDGGEKYILRISRLKDRTEEDYLAETEFVHYLAAHGAPVTDAIKSKNGNFVERIENAEDNSLFYVCVFEYARGMLISDNGYRYRKGAPLSEYFYNTGKTLGRIHALSKEYRPVHYRADYFDKYNMEYIDKLIPDTYTKLKKAISSRLDIFSALPKDKASYGLVHFDFSDGNYHINMEDGGITVFDFDNAMYCWYMFDLANLWTHGVGWCAFMHDAQERRAFMTDYFETVLSGYRSETDLPESASENVQAFIDMVLIENIVDEFECCTRRGEEVDYEDIEAASESLIHDLPWAGFFEE